MITVKNGFAVQSLGYKRYLPIGNPVVVAENLDRWGVDEIIILEIDRSVRRLGPNYELLNALGKLPLSTPLTYAGGVRNVEQASSVIKAGAERVCVDALLQDDLGALRKISEHIGSQALLASLPLSSEAGQLYWYNYLDQTRRLAEKTIRHVFEDAMVSEALIIDWQHEGIRNSFDFDLLHNFSEPAVPIIAFGGMSEIVQVEKALSMEKVVAVGVGNFLYYTEHSVQKYKECLALTVLRAPEYQRLVR